MIYERVVRCRLHKGSSIISISLIHRILTLTFTHLIYIITLLSHVQLGVPIDLSNVGLTTRIFKAVRFLPILAICSANFKPLDLITLAWLCEWYELWRHLRNTFSSLRFHWYWVKHRLIILFSNTFSLWFFLNQICYVLWSFGKIENIVPFQIRFSREKFEPGPEFEPRSRVNFFVLKI